VAEGQGEPRERCLTWKLELLKKHILGALHPSGPQTSDGENETHTGRNSRREESYKEGRRGKKGGNYRGIPKEGVDDVWHRR